MSTDAAPVAVGLAGAGPWARRIHAPMLAAGPETRLAAVWTRTPARGRALAAEHGVRAVDSFAALCDVSEAIALAVPPAVQPDLAIEAARRGRPVLLEKPIGPDLGAARRVADAVGASGVGSIVVLTYRFRPNFRAFRDAVASFDVLGARASFLSGAFLGGDYAGGWRDEAGCVADIGPHVLDLADAALGPVRRVQAAGDPHGWVSAILEHDGGTTTEVAMSCRAAVPSRTAIECYGPDGLLEFDGRAGERDDFIPVLRAELADVVRSGATHECDVERGLLAQQLVDAVERSLATGAPVAVGRR